MGFNAIEDRFSSKEEVFTVSDAQAFRQLGNAVVPEIVEEIAMETNIKLDINGFRKLMSAQKIQSRKNSNFTIKDTSFINKKSFSQLSIL